MKNKSGNLIFCQAQVPYDNLGDLVITKVLLTNLRNYGHVIVNIKGVPDWYCQQLELTEEEKASSYKLPFPILVLLFRLRTLIDSNANIYLLMRPGHVFGSGFSNSIKMFMSAIYCFVMKILGVRICRFGTSIGPFSSLMQIGEKWKSNAMYFYSARDTISANYAKKIGIDKVEIFPDMAWLIKKQNANDNLAWLMQTPNANKQPIHVDGDYVVFSFRDTFREFNNPEYKNNLCATLDSIVQLVCVEWGKTLVIAHQVDWDYEFCKWLSDRYQNSCKIVFIERYIDSQYMYDLYSGAFMVFSNRLHVLLLAMLCGALSMAVVERASEHKITGIFSDAGLSRLIVDIDRGSSSVDILPGIAADADRIKAEIALAFERNRNYGESLLKRVMTGEI